MNLPSILKSRCSTFVSGIVIGSLLLIAVAWFWGPRKHSTFEDPLTGQYKHEVKWLGTEVSSRTEDNEVSTWATPHLPVGMYPGQYGWNHVTSNGRTKWFGNEYYACGGGYAVPNAIFRDELEDQSLEREAALQAYWAELVAEYKKHGSTKATQVKWSPYR